MTPSRIEPDGRRSARSSRWQVLAYLRGENRPMAITDVAGHLGLHPNTVRLHLDSLVATGLATRDTQRGDGRGRPRLVYTAGAEPRFDPAQDASEGGGGGYRLLAQILTNHLESTAARPIEEAADAGRAWGRLLAEQRAAPGVAQEPTSMGEATAQLAGLLGDLGFAPGAAVPGETIEVHHCPFGQVPGRHSPVVCAVHLGLMQGALARRGAPVQATGVEPFVTPRMCVARLGTAAPNAASPPVTRQSIVDSESAS